MQIGEDEREALYRANPNIWDGAKCPRCGGPITKALNPITTRHPVPLAEGDRRVTRIVQDAYGNKGDTVIEYEHTIVATCKPCAVGFTAEQLRAIGRRDAR